MIRRLVWSSLAIAVLACSDTLGPTTTGRWASLGIELRMIPLARRFTVGCDASVAISPSVRFDDTGTIRFSGNLTNSSGSYPFAFVGQLAGDTLVASLSVTWGSAGTVTNTRAMIRDGDPEWYLLDCVGP